MYGGEMYGGECFSVRKSKVALACIGVIVHELKHQTLNKIVASTINAVLGFTLLSSLASASEYCTKEQYERDHALIADAFSNGTLAKSPKAFESRS